MDLIWRCNVLRFQVSIKKKMNSIKNILLLVNQVCLSEIPNIFKNKNDIRLTYILYFFRNFYSDVSHVWILLKSYIKATFTWNFTSCKHKLILKLHLHRILLRVNVNLSKIYQYFCVFRSNLESTKYLLRVM